MKPKARLIEDPCTLKYIFIRDFQEAMNNLKLQAGSMGVEPARLIFAPFVSWQQNVERGFAGDLFLDTPLYENPASLHGAVL
jgi:predicted O-linked N-acetylglucosamine transferase (SPINDLY family)